MQEKKWLLPWHSCSSCCNVQASHTTHRKSFCPLELQDTKWSDKKCSDESEIDYKCGSSLMVCWAAFLHRQSSHVLGWSALLNGKVVWQEVLCKILHDKPELSDVFYWPDSVLAALRIAGTAGITDTSCSCSSCIELPAAAMFCSQQYNSGRVRAHIW